MVNEVTEQKPQEAPEASTSIISSILSFVLPTAHAEAPEEGDKEEKEDGDGDEEEKDDSEGGGDDEEEEDEPEDIAPAIREDCQNGECAKLAQHFQACQDKVEAGKGWEGEDCVDEMFHMMHCVDACSAPKLFKKLA